MNVRSCRLEALYMMILLYSNTYKKCSTCNGYSRSKSIKRGHQGNYVTHTATPSIPKTPPSQVTPTTADSVEFGSKHWQPGLIAEYTSRVRYRKFKEREKEILKKLWDTGELGGIGKHYSPTINEWQCNWEDLWSWSSIMVNVLWHM